MIYLGNASNYGRDNFSPSFTASQGGEDDFFKKRRRRKKRILRRKRPLKSIRSLKLFKRSKTDQKAVKKVEKKPVKKMEKKKVSPKAIMPVKKNTAKKTPLKLTKPKNKSVTPKVITETVNKTSQTAVKVQPMDQELSIQVADQLADDKPKTLLATLSPVKKGLIGCTVLLGGYFLISQAFKNKSVGTA